MTGRDPVAFLGEAYRELVKNDLDWKLRILEGPSTPRCVVDGRRVIMLCSNNYLSLSNHPKVKEAALEAVRTHGAGSGSVRPIAGNMDIHVELERRLAAFKEAEASLVYQTGFAANAGLIPQLAEAGDLIVSDELNHGSIIDGVRLSKADRSVYRHGDAGHLSWLADQAYSAIRIDGDLHLDNVKRRYELAAVASRLGGDPATPDFLRSLLLDAGLGAESLAALDRRVAALLESVRNIQQSVHGEIRYGGQDDA